MKHYEEEHLTKCVIERKIEYLSDLRNAVSRSFSGRIGAELSTTFLFESEKMIANSIKQYELGYFDAAFYSLRATLELFMLLVYFLEHQTIELTDHLKKWNKLENMDTYSRMDKYLSKNSDLYIDIKSNMADYFDTIRDLNLLLNKKLHKQSFHNFYTNREHFVAGRNFSKEKEIEEFDEAVRKIIGAVIVFRLFIDPMPILLMDEDIYLRTKDTISGPLPFGFVEKYIGVEHIESYKKTEIYQLHYEQMMEDPKFFPSVAHLMKHKHIDLNKKDEILEQMHHLYDNDAMSFRIACESKHVYAIDVYNGMIKYSTSNVPAEKEPYYRNMDHIKYLKLKEDILNEEFEDIIISIFALEKQRIFIEQGEKLDLETLKRIKNIILEYLN